MNPGSPPFARPSSVRAPLVRRAFALACWLALSLANAFAQQGDVRVQLSSPTIAIGESVRLAIVASGIDGELDASALEREFDVVGRSSSRDVQISNGTRRSTVTWVLELVPREVGVFTVPSVSVGGIESELVTLTVTEAPTGAARDIFVEASVDTRTPYVQSQVLLTLAVFRAVDIVDGSLGEPSGDGLDVRALGDDTRREELRDGRRYAVVERRFALFPQRSGPLVVEPITLSVTVPSDPTRARGFFAPTKRLTRRTAPIELDVRARPAGGDGWWLPATDVALEEEWSAAADEGVRVGEPLTRTVRLRARGALDTQLPDIEPGRVDGLAIYADDPVRAGDVGANGIESTLTLAVAVIPERAGTFELPPLALDWFDVDEGRTRTATLPSRTVTVLSEEGGGPNGEPGAEASARGVDARDEETRDGEAEAASVAVDAGARDVAADGAGAVSGSAPDADARGAARWRTLALGAFGGWVLTAVALALAMWRRRGESALRTGAGPDGAGRDARPSGTAAVRDARRRVERAARDGDARALARAVLERARLQRPDDAPRSLDALARRLETTGWPDGDAGGRGDEGEARALALPTALRRLDAAVYGRGATGSDALDGVALESLPARLERALDALGDRTATGERGGGVRTPADGSELPPL